jgi:hypothetical protein
MQESLSILWPCTVRKQSACNGAGHEHRTTDSPKRRHLKGAKEKIFFALSLSTKRGPPGVEYSEGPIFGPPLNLYRPLLAEWRHRFQHADERIFESEASCNDI